MIDCSGVLGRATQVGNFVSNIQYESYGPVKSYQNANGLLSTFESSPRGELNGFTVGTAMSVNYSRYLGKL